MKSEEIAKLAGVSRSTVSRVINNYPNVPPKTREKVERVIREYGYRPNNSARNLAGKPANAIGLFFVEFFSGEYDEMEENIIHSSPFYSEFLAHAIDQLKKRGYQLTVSIISRQDDFDMIETAYANKSISGCIMMGDIVPDVVLERLSRQGLPTILINQRSKIEFKNIYLINTENYAGAYGAVQLLIDNGHTRIAHITGAFEKASVRERFEGYRDCLGHNQISYNENYIYQTHIHRAESGYTAMEALLKKNKEAPFTAVFAANDLLAFGAIRCMQDKKIRVPQDISIIGYDNAELSGFIAPPLTTVSVSVKAVTKRAVTSLIAVIEKKEKVPSFAKEETFTLIERKSVRKLS